jgi:hypothetical protein
MSNVIVFVALALMEGFLCLFFLFNLPVDPKNVWMGGLSPTRVFLIGTVLAVELGIGWTAYQWHTRRSFAQKLKGGFQKIFATPTFSFIFLSLLVIGVGIGGVFFISWFILGKKYLAIYQRLAPVVFLGTALSLQFLWLCWPTFHRAGMIPHPLYLRGLALIQRYRILELSLASAFILVSVVYFNFATLNSPQNPNMDATDQGAYLNFVEEIYRTDYHFSGTRNRMPLYPSLQVLFYDPAQTRQENFEHGKQVNAGLSFVLLLLLAGVVSRFLKGGLGLLFTGLIAFGLFVFKASYLQAELLFYTLSFLTFLVMGRVLVTPSWRAGILAGVLAALAHLTKASILPMVGLFLGFYVLKTLAELWRAPDRAGLSQQFLFHSGVMIYFLLPFLGILTPYLYESKQIYGQYFYNVNSTFYVWYDNWEEVQNGTKAAGDRVGWPVMPPEDIPCLDKYLREHTPVQILDRFWSGLKIQSRTLSRPYTRYNYLALYLGALLVTGASLPKTTYPLLKRHLIPLGFALTTFTAYLLLYAWYVPISKGPRFTFSLVLPLLFTGMLALQALTAQAKPIRFFRTPISPSRLLGLFNFAMLLLLLIDLLKYIPGELATKYFGN